MESFSKPTTIKIDYYILYVVWHMNLDTLSRCKSSQARKLFKTHKSITVCLMIIHKITLGEDC